MSSSIEDFRQQRERLLGKIAEEKIAAPAVLDAMRQTPRQAFVSDDLQQAAYRDAALPIASGQTISQPSVVAMMAGALQLTPTDRVLEIGTGSGYAAAVLARLAGAVYTIERHQELAETAQRRFEELGLTNIQVRIGDGTLGWPEHAPYDAVSVTAAASEIPPALVEQLADGGRVVTPLGTQRDWQRLIVATKLPDGRLRQTELAQVRFVPLIGDT